MEKLNTKIRKALEDGEDRLEIYWPDYHTVKKRVQIAVNQVCPVGEKLKTVSLPNNRLLIIRMKHVDHDNPPLGV